MRPDESLEPVREDIPKAINATETYPRRQEATHNLVAMNPLRIESLANDFGRNVGTADTKFPKNIFRKSSADAENEWIP